MTFSHRLLESGLFDDAALARALDDHPADLYDINIFDFDAEGQHVMRTGARGAVSGEQVLKGLSQGNLWMQMRDLTGQSPQFRALIEQAYAEIAGQAGAFAPRSVSGQLLLSAPGAGVPMHADAPWVILFHLRGRKRIWIYPADPEHMPRERMELIVMKQQTEDLPYQRDMDGAAMVFDLEPGMAVSWPLHAPHRVENLDTACLSLTTEFQTWGSRITNGAYYANGVLRRSGVTPWPMDKTPMAARTALWALSLALKRLPLVEDRLAGARRDFNLDDRVAA
jgi:hypothetical protein